MPTSTLASTRPNATLPVPLPFGGTVPVGRAPGVDGLAAMAGIGRELVWLWSRGVRPIGVAARPVEVFAVVVFVIDHGVEVDLDTAAGLVMSHVAGQFDVVEQHEARTLAEIGRFFRFAGARGARTLSDVTPEVVTDFADLPYQASSGAWTAPSDKTRGTRVGAVRVLFAATRTLGLHRVDPTVDIRIGAPTGSRCRPLTDEEEALGRLWSGRTLVNGRHAVAWALHQAGATLTEAAHVAVDAVNLDAGTVWLAGNKNRIERLAPLTDWGAARLAERIGELDGAPAETRLLTTARASKNARTASTGALIGEVFRWAGLAGDASLEPRSLPAWAGRRVFERTGRIEDAARFLGVRNLQTAAEIIGHDW